MIVKNRIWEELYWAQLCSLFTMQFTARHRRYNRYYETFIAVTASLGAFGFLKFYIAPLISTILIGIISVARSMFPSLIIKDEELSTLDGISLFYLDYMNQLEQLFYKYRNHLFDDDKQLNENKAAEELFKLKEKECEKKAQLNKYLRRFSKKEHEGINLLAKEYVKRVYYNKYLHKDSDLEGNTNDVNV